MDLVVTVVRWSELSISSASFQMSLLTNCCHRERYQDCYRCSDATSSSCRAIIEIWKSLSRMQSKILSPWEPGDWSGSHSWEYPLKLPRIIIFGADLMSEGSKEFFWVVVLGNYIFLSSNQVGLLVFIRIERIFLIGFSNFALYQRGYTL